MMSDFVYLMCAITSMLCTVLLYLNFRKTRSRLLLWSGICFLCLAINNILLYTDLVIAPGMDLLVLRTIPAVIGFAALIWGFIWDNQ